MEVRDLEQICWAMPTIYHFRTFEDRPAFFRWRHGGLKVTVGPPGASMGADGTPPGPYDEGWWYVYVGGVPFLDFPDVTNGEFPEEDAKRFLAMLPNNLHAGAVPCQ